MALDIKERFVSYTERWTLIWYALKCFFTSLRRGSDEVGDRTFARLYTSLSHEFAKCEADATPVPRLVGLADGITLELGPGCGNQLPRYNVKQIDHVYGIEPNAHIIPALEEKLKTMPDLKSLYTAINVALEDDQALKAHGILDGSLDTIVCMQVLCSVQNVDEAAKRCHRLLKPGGQFLFWEHQASGDALTKVVQRIWNVVWSPLIGGCAMGVEVEEALQKAGPWDMVEFGRDTDRPYNLLPRVWGRFVKLEG